MATYAFQKYLGNNEIKVDGIPKWRYIVKETIESTRKTFKVRLNFHQ